MTQVIAAAPKSDSTAFRILSAISFCHFLNDMMQSVLPAIYPILKGGFDLSFVEIGLLTLTYQAMASLLQPLVGSFTDRRPQAYSLPVGMSFTLLGMATLALAGNYGTLLAGAAMLGIGSSIFHPESSRIARLASGGQDGLAQSLFQVGGNCGSAVGPLLAAFFILPRGKGSLAWLTLAALTGIAVLTLLGRWYKSQGHARPARKRAAAVDHHLPPRRVAIAVAVLLALIFSKYFYLASITSYYTFYLMHHFGLSIRSAQIYLFVFLAASAAGVIIGGPVGDRIGRKYVIWGSILGVLPFTLALPYASLPWTIVLSVVIGLVLSSAFSAILVYATELLPNRVGMVAGMFFGFAFGMGGIGAAALGLLADRTSIEFVYHVCSFLPLIGLLTVLLPNLETVAQQRRRTA